MAYESDRFDAPRIPEGPPSAGWPQPPSAPAPPSFAAPEVTAPDAPSPLAPAGGDGAGLDSVVIGPARSARSNGNGSGGANGAAPGAPVLPFGTTPGAYRGGSSLFPEPDDAGSKRNLYVITGNVLGAALGVLTIAALIASLVVAIRHEKPEPIYSANAANRAGGGGGTGDETMDYSTSGQGTDGSTGTSSSDTSAAAGTGTSTGDTASGGDSSGTSTDSGATTPTGGAFKFAPPAGMYPATGTGFRVNQPPGGAGVKVSNPSIEVKNASGGCYDIKVTAEPDNATTLTMCATADGGVVQPKNIQYLRTVIVGNLAEVNTATLACNPPALVLPANAAPGQAGDIGGNCIGDSSSDKVPGTYKQAGTYKIVAKETVKGVEAIHLRQDITQKPNDAQNTQDGVMSQDIWFAPNGLPVRFMTKIDATSCIVNCNALKVKFHQEFDITVNSTTPG